MQTKGIEVPTRFDPRRLLAPLLLVGGAALLVFVTSLPPMCPLRVALGIPCPSCGLTRATRLALHGDFAGATHLHPLWMVIVPLVAAWMLAEIVSYLRTGAFFPLERFPPVLRVAQVLLALLVVVWIARFFGAFGGPCPI